MSRQSRERPYRVWLYRKYRDVRLDGRHHLVWLDLHTDDDQVQQANQQHLRRLFEQLVTADGGTRWDQQDSQLMLTAEMDDGVHLGSNNSFWWTPDLEERR